MSPLTIRLILCLSVVGLAASTARAQEQPTGSWSGEANGQTFYYGGSASDGTRLYLVGGFQFGVVNTFPQYYQQLRRYDPAANFFQTLAPMPFPKYYTTAAVYEGNLYCFGGINANSGITNTIERYTFATNSWAVLGTTLSTARYLLASARLGDRIYVTGGFSNGGQTNLNEEFNPLDNSIVARASVPNSVYYHSATAVPSLDRLYVVGGFGGGGVSAATYEYTPPSEFSISGSWSVRASLPAARYAAASFSLNDRVYITGGIVGSTIQSSTMEFDPAANDWAQRASMSATRYLHAAAAIGGKGYVYGGPVSPTTGEEFTPPAFNEPPVADAGPDQTVECASHDGTEVNLDGTASFDPEGEELYFFWEGEFGFAEGPTPTVVLPLGAHEITLTVMDSFGETSSDSVLITVEDTLAPEFETLAVSPESIWPPNGEMVAVTVTASIVDLCDPNPTVEIIAIESNQEAGEESDWEITGELTAQVRAQRSGSGARVYTITLQATDEMGNVALATLTVTVPHDQGN